MESPQDPATYLETEEGQENPSFFEWPLLQRLVEEEELKLIQMDQGATGCVRRKPNCSPTFQVLKILTAFEEDRWNRLKGASRSE